MLKELYNKKAQVVAAEYIFVFFIFAAVLGLMAVYIRRTVQARIYDARNTMIDMVKTRTAGYYNGNVYAGYEPYYSNKVTFIQRETYDKTRLIDSGPSGAGIFKKDVNYKTKVKAASYTLPPKDAN